MRLISATSVTSSSLAVLQACRAVSAAKLGHGVGQNPQAVFALLVGERERWRDSEHVPELTTLSDEETITTAGLERGRGSRGIRRRGARPAKLDSDHQSLTANLSDARTARGCLPQPGKQSGALLRRIRLQVVLDDVVKGGQPGPR